jgi:hypothetical protein
MVVAVIALAVVTSLPKLPAPATIEHMTNFRSPRRIASSIFIAICLCTLALAAEPREWVKTDRLPAREANQAAAADERYVYAVDNAVIARYDRKSRERIDASIGDAKHLNSGFLHEGKLYCAHSNYPGTPEQSEIKVLDPMTMKLTTFQDFGNFGGSLTWVVWHEGHWWCNFARYGKQNHETFLVKFNAEWKEQARWTYPQAIIDKLGTYSISGGVWLSDEILATDHDHRVIYRLRLPTAGQTLELVGEDRTPFPGQGIAVDPATKGIIGIDRGKKEVVFAEAK